MNYICKICGRAMKLEGNPKYCYYDRADSIENISDEDSKKFQIQIKEDYELDSIQFEFPGDLRWHPINGKAIKPIIGGDTLTKYQEKLMRNVYFQRI